MNESEKEIPSYPSNEAVRYQAGVNFLIFIFLFPIWMQIIFPAESTFTFTIGWLLYFLINTYGCYRFTQTKKHLKQNSPTTQNERSAVLYDYHFYLNLKASFFKNLCRFGICAVFAFLVTLLYQMNILKIFMAFSMLILIPLSGFFLGYLYFQLPLFFANYYLIHRELDLDYEQIEYELRQINLQSLIQQVPAVNNENEKQDQIKPSDTIEATILKNQSKTIDEISDETSTPDTPALKTEKILSEIEVLMEHLREQFINLPLTQLRAFNQLIEVLQYLENQHQTLSLSNRKKLMLIIQQIQQNLKQDFEKYFKYSEDQRIQYHPEDKLIPDLWFRKQIEKNTQQLIEQTNFIYEHYLNSFTDHQTFIDQKFTRIQDFKIVLEPHKVKKPPLDK